MRDIRDLISWVFCSGVGIKWAIVKKSHLIERIVVISMPSLRPDTFNAAKNLGEEFKESFSYLRSKAATKAPGKDHRVYDGISVLLRIPISKNRLVKLRREQKQQDMAIGSGQSKADEDEQIYKPQFYILSKRELVLNNYPRPSTVDKYYQVIDSSTGDINAEHKLIAIDCEMALTNHGPELVRVSIVDKDLKVLYDTLVKPKAQILDYLTQFSGITEEMLRDVKVTLKDVQKDLLEIITPNTIIIGHSLENDLHSLKIVHDKVVDTALLYPHARGGMHKYALKFLAYSFLKENIQEGEHDSIVDAQTAMKLALLKFEKGDSFGVSPQNPEENIMDLLHRNQKKTAMIDTPDMCKIYSSVNSDCFPIENDKSAIDSSLKAIASQKYQFIYTRLSSLESYYKGSKGFEDDANIDEYDEDINNVDENELEEDNQGSDDRTVLNDQEQNGSHNREESITSRDEELSIVEKMFKQVREIRQKLPKNTLFIITGAHGNIHRLYGISKKRREKKSMGVWTEEDESRFMQEAKFERDSISFFEVT